MTGASIVASLQVDDAKRAIGRLSALTSSGALMRVLGVGLVETTLQRFEDAKDAQGNPWRALNPVYAGEKRGAGILREKAMRGGLMGSISFQVRSATEVAIGSNKVYAAIHQFGGVIRPKSAHSLVFKLGGRTIHAKQVTIPARPYLGFGEADRVMVMDILGREIGGAWRGA